MDMIVCGWCGKATANHDRCTSCGHEDPERPWQQRGQEAPVVDHRADDARRLAAARTALLDAGLKPTIEALAERMDVSPRTVRRMAAGGRATASSAHRPTARIAP